MKEQANARAGLTTTKSDARDSSPLVTTRGTTTITAESVAHITGELLRRIPEVHALAPTGVNQALTLLARRARGKLMRTLGVEVEVGAKEVAIDIRIVVEYPNSLSQAAERARAVLLSEIPAQTGLRVVEVNVEVVDLHFAADEEKIETNAARVV